MDDSGIQESQLNGVSVRYDDIQNLVTVNLNEIEDAAIRVYHVNGAIVHQAQNINNSIYNFDLSTNPGLYIAVIESKGQNGHFKVLKTN